jgi:tRNA threonylcarbamoyladenosine biosynthesis protein TsaB
MTIPSLLAIDASSSNCSVALQQSGVTDSIIINNTQLQAALLLPTIDALLKTHNLSLSELDGLVLSNGPGRFTGLRISNSCIQGLAYCFNKKIITINSLQLYAQQFINLGISESTKSIWVCTKAYSDYYYQAKYRVEKGLTYLITEPNQVYIKNKADILLELYKLDNYDCVGDGWHDILLQSHDKSDSYVALLDIKHGFVLANLEFERNNLLDASEVLPFYAVNPYS